MKQWTPQMKHKKESAVIKLIEKQLSDIGQNITTFMVIKWVEVTVNPIYSQWIKMVGLSVLRPKPITVKFTLIN